MHTRLGEPGRVRRRHGLPKRAHRSHLGARAHTLGRSVPLDSAAPTPIVAILSAGPQFANKIDELLDRVQASGSQVHRGLINKCCWGGGAGDWVPGIARGGAVTLAGTAAGTRQGCGKP